MAYLVGTVTKEEEAELARDGWELEVLDEDSALIPPSAADKTRYRVVFIDEDLFELLSSRKP